MTDQNIDQQGQGADDYYQDIVVEDAASVPDGCLGLVVITFAVGVIVKLLL
jgi:hypothetical protein